MAALNRSRRLRLTQGTLQANFIFKRICAVTETSPGRRTAFLPEPPGTLGAADHEPIEWSA